MIESWLQISCDGCDTEDSTATAGMPNLTRLEYRKQMQDYGWRSYGALDYCRSCVEKGRHIERKSIYDSDPALPQTPTLDPSA